jgi:hypothetical protein
MARSARLHSLVMCVSLLLGVAGCAGAPRPISAGEVRGLWHIDGATILDHARKETGREACDGREAARLLALADQVGTGYGVQVKADGTWEFQSMSTGANIARETAIFASLLQIDPVTPEAQAFYWNHRFPMDPKRPYTGTWMIDAQGMAHYQAADAGVSPGRQQISGSGVIRRSERGIEWVQDGSGVSVRLVPAQPHASGG